MAVLTDERGQLLLVAAVGLAILLALMALVVHTAVFGEVRVAGTDESVTAERGALQYQDAVRRGVGGLLASANAAYNDSSTLETTLEDELRQWVELAGPAYEREAVTTGASLERVSYETRIVQDEEGDFRSAVNDTSWMLADNVTTIREFEMSINATGIRLIVPDDDCDVGGQGCFEFSVNGDWQLFAYNESSGVSVIVNDSSGTSETPCGPDVKSVSIDILAGEFENDKCANFTSFLDDGGITSPFNITYTNAENITGTYEITVDGLVEDDERYADNESPYLETRIDRADVAVRYRSVTLDYETEIRVEPGERDG